MSSNSRSQLDSRQKRRINDVELKCKHIGISEPSIVQLACRFYLRTLECEPTDVQAWLACSIWVANQASESKGTHEISLSQLLQLCHMKLEVFVEVYKRFIKHFEHDLQSYTLQARNFLKFLCTNLALFKHYEKLFNAIVLNIDPNQKRKRKRASGSDSPKQGYSKTLFGCGWLLFLNAKAQFRLMGIDDLDQLKALLLCVIRFLRGAQQSQLSGGKKVQESTEDVVFTQEDSPYVLLNKDIPERIRIEVRDKFYVFLSELCGEKDLQCSSEKSFDILSEPNLIKNSYSLSEQYDKLLKSHTPITTPLQPQQPAGSPSPPPPIGGADPPPPQSQTSKTHSFWLDERLFLDEKFKQIETKTTSLTVPQLSPYEQDRQEWLSGPPESPQKNVNAFSPLARSPAFQPVRQLQNVSAYTWLANTLRHQNVIPTITLQQFLNSCPPNPVRAIMTLVIDLSQRIRFKNPIVSSPVRLLFTDKVENPCPKRALAQKLFWQNLLDYYRMEIFMPAS